jgi:hypothetical protein
MPGKWKDLRWKILHMVLWGKITETLKRGHKALVKLQVNPELVSPSHLPTSANSEIYFHFFRSFVWVRHLYRC